MEEEERQESAKQATNTSGQAPLIYDDVPDPEEDELDDLDGMNRAPLNTCGAHDFFVSRYAR